MALTKELLKQNEGLAGLSDDQLAAIEQLSLNEQKAVLDKELGERTNTIYSGLDADIAATTGIAKITHTDGKLERTFEYAKRVLGQLKEKATIADQIKAENEKLAAQLKEGKGNEALTGKYAELEDKYTQLSSKYETDLTEWQKKVEAEKQANDLLQINSEFNRALTGVKFKPYEVIAEADQKTLIEAAKNRLLTSYDKEWSQDQSGNRFLQFKDKTTGLVLKNPENGLNPFTPKELLLKSLSGIIETSRQQAGAGTSTPQTPVNGTVSINGAKTQSEAYQVIKEQLNTMGLANGTKEFQEQMDKAWNEQNVVSLPAQ